jgi:histidinol phosphatase-like PHP family hydrolase
MPSGSIEMHVHTRAGSADSSITVDELGARAVAAGVGGIVVSEHFRVWSDWERSAFFDRWGVRIYRAIEATTDIGHVILLGAPEGMSPTYDGRALLRTARKDGLYSILAHPFRYYFDAVHSSQRPVFPANKSAEELAGEELFSLVEAIEIENGGCNDRENAFAAAVAMHTGLPVTLGSDAHHPHELGVITLPVPEIPSSCGELVDLLASLTLREMDYTRGRAGAGVADGPAK